MPPVNMLQAKSSLSRLVEAIEQGREREIVIARNGRPAAKLVPVDAHTLEAEMARTHDLNSLFAALSARGVVVTSMRNKANRLEELFVRLVEGNNGQAAA